MRRADRELSLEEARDILEKGTFGVLSTVGEDGLPYGVPVSYAVDHDTIYFHGTIEGGKKTDNIACHPNVSFTVVGDTNVLPAKFSTQYESVIVEGRARISDTPQIGLERLVDKYSSDYKNDGMKYIKSDTKKTLVYEIKIEKMTGKARR